MRVRALLALALATALAGCRGSSGCAGCAGEPYDPGPMLDSLREEERRSLAALAGLEAVSELPLHSITVDLDTGLLTFAGAETLVLTNRTGRPLEDVVLRLYPNSRELDPAGTRNLVVHDVMVEGEPVQVEELRPTALRVPLPRALPAGRSVTIRMGFRGTLPRHGELEVGSLGAGLGQLLQLLAGGEAQAGDYGVFGTSAGIANMGLWYPRLADWTGQGWDADEPAGLGDTSTVDLGNYLVEATTAGDVVVVTSGSLLSDDELEGGRRRRTFAVAAARSFAMQASSLYRQTERRVGEVVVRSSCDAAHAARCERVAEAARGALEVYERRFGRYPWTELDLAEAPLRGAAGGVEWPGLVTIARVLFEDPGSAPPLAGVGAPGLVGPTAELWDETLEFVVAHEVAHQYWNAVVGSDSRRHPHVDEALAQFSAAVYFEDRYGPERGRRAMERQVRLGYHVYRLLGGSDGAVDRPVDRFGSVLEYAGLVYGKGPYYYAALRDELGQGAFWQGLRTYYERHRFRVVGPEALTAVMAEVSANAPAVEALTRRWLHEAHGDEDLGRASLAGVLEPVLGPEAVALVGQLEALLGELQGGGGGVGQALSDMMRSLGGGAPGPSTGAGLGGLLDQLGRGLGTPPPGPPGGAPPANPGP